MFTYHALKKTLHTFMKNWSAYLILVISLDLILSFLIVPLMRWFTRLIMITNRVPYVSYTNIGWLFTKRPAAVVELLVLALIILILVFWQFAFLLTGVANILKLQEQRLTVVLKASLRSLLHLRVSSFLFFIPYFVLVLPFSENYLSSPLLAKIQIPVFIIEFLQQKPRYAILLAFGTLIVSYLALRLIQALPLMVIKKQHGFTAAKTSWVLTRHHLWAYIWRLVMLGFSGLVATGTVSLILYGLQLLLDKTPKLIAFSGAVINMGLLSIWSRIIGAVILVNFILLLLMMLDAQAPFVLNVQATKQPKRLASHRWIPLILVAIFLTSQISFNIYYLRGAVLTQPLTISHRGVDNENGVQNTIPALIKTSKEKPDYVEMDLHETKDHQFVVMHDENLKQLTGVNKAPYQLKLKQLTRLKAHENGHVAPVASFDTYLRAAETHHQKLLVELKTTAHDSKNMLTRFDRRYAHRLMADHDMVHSLDYQVISGLKKLTPKLKVSYILPYNLTFPQTSADAYTMEETTLNSAFVTQVHYNHQAVFAWTINDRDDMTKMFFLNVDGVVTDKLTLLKQTIKSNFDHPSYASRLLIYSNELDNLTSLSKTALN
ncbi:glycerophosphoryl diester phosphodiesterase membrane domain-containing protein [Pediococcus siamensis]|uniref:glycerophosphoryl diester phosphodiesterase membrane domain-containing protein n=1 Tax=Pediococcus siamensis TaxID=381829 RepID=UPI0039A2BAB9